ncbi:MAG: flavin reductase family protein [Hyphomonadaceae bacterium]|nr:flavin reductase family protein [Hyphomonadaceae bacterium]
MSDPIGGVVDFDAKAFRAALGSFATGVTIVTARHDESDCGVTANSFNSVSLDPPMVLWSLSKAAQSLPCFAASPHFAVHILAHDQQDLSNRFATRGVDKFAEVDLSRGVGGVPLLEGCNARFQCQKVFEYDGGDHIIFVGEVLAFDHVAKDPLLFHGGRYARKAPDESQPASTDAAHENLLLLVTSAYYSLRALALKEAERRGLSLSERHVLGVLEQRGGRTIAEVNELLEYVGLGIDPDLIGKMAHRALLTVADDGGLWITSKGRDCVVALVAAAKAREAEVELNLGHQASTLKQLLSLLLKVQDADHRHGRHIKLIRAVTGLAGS